MIVAATASHATVESKALGLKSWEQSYQQQRGDLMATVSLLVSFF